LPALDTNVLLRYFLQDDRAQFNAAQRLIRRCVAKRLALFVPITVFLELEWVLRSKMGFDKFRTLDLMSDLLASDELLFESEHALIAALHLYRTNSADFADTLHLALASLAGQQPFWTFDHAASRLSGAKKLGSFAAPGHSK